MCLYCSFICTCTCICTCIYYCFCICYRLYLCRVTPAQPIVTSCILARIHSSHCSVLRQAQIVWFATEIHQLQGGSFVKLLFLQRKSDSWLCKKTLWCLSPSPMSSGQVTKRENLKWGSQLILISNSQSVAFFTS